MITLSAGAESVGSGPNRASVKVVAGTRNCLDLLLRADMKPTFTP